MLVELDVEEQKQYEKLVDFPGSSFTSHVADVIANRSPLHQYQRTC